MSKAKHILTHEHLKILYYSLIHPYLLYGIIMWGNTYKSNLSKLEKLQKKSLRIISGAKYNDHTSPLFKNAEILKLHDIYRSQVACFMFDFINNNLPVSLSSIYEYPSDDHTYNTRHRTDPKLPKVYSELARRSVFYTGPNLWLTLDESVKTASFSVTNSALS